MKLFPNFKSIPAVEITRPDSDKGYEFIRTIKLFIFLFP